MMTDIHDQDRSWPVGLIRASSAAINSLLTGSELGAVTWYKETGPVKVADAAQAPREEEGQKTVVHAHHDEEAETEPQSKTAADIPPDIWELSQQLHAACRRRRFMVGPVERDAIRIGPTLVSLSLGLVAGASIREITAAEQDLAREVGAESIEIANDPDRPFYVRFLMLRPRRAFPSVPDLAPESVSVEAGAYLGVYLGQDVVGADQQVFISTWPHALVGGTTGSGKTTLLRSILTQLGQSGPSRSQVIVVDGKGETDYVGVVPSEMYVPDFQHPQVDPDSPVEVVGGF